MTELIFKSEQAEWQMLSSVLHAMRLQLHAMSGFLQVLENDWPVLEADEVGELCQRMAESIVRQELLVNTTIDLVFIESQTQLSCGDVVAVNSLCREVIGGYGGEVRFESDLPDSRMLQTNRKGLGKVVGYLVAYGMDKTRRLPRQSGTAVVLALHSSSGSKLEVSITAAGAQLSPAERQQLFELPIGNTGLVNPAQLGLRVARRIMALIGGHLYIDTNYADGVRIVAELGMYHQILTSRLSTS